MFEHHLLPFLIIVMLSFFGNCMQFRYGVVKLIIKSFAVYTFLPMFVASLDYGNTTQSLQFRAGENCVDIETLEDSRFEEREQFYTYLAIATTTGAKILHSCHRIDIEDNEG